MKTIALIPARLESRRFPNKLIKKLGDSSLAGIKFRYISRTKYI